MSHPSSNLSARGGKIERHEALLDPLQALPSEAFCGLIFFLPPSSIARSSAVSRRWRNEIHSNPSLWTEVDLSSLGTKNGFANEDVLFHLHRLSQLSLNRLTKVTLNLTSFWKRSHFTLIRSRRGCFIDNSPNAKDQDLKNPLSFLIDSQSHLNIKELKIVLESSKDRFEDSSYFLETLVDFAERFSSLKRFRIKAPTMFGLSAGKRYNKSTLGLESRPNSRVLEIENNFFGNLDSMKGLVKDIQGLQAEVSEADFNAFIKRDLELLASAAQAQVEVGDGDLAQDDDDDDEGNVGISNLTIASLLQKVTQWVGRGLTTFTNTSLKSLFDGDREVMDQLKQSVSTLQQIKVHIKSERERRSIWDLALSSPNLISFDLRPAQFPRTSPERLTKVLFPDENGEEKIGTQLEMRDFNLNWRKVREWLISDNTEFLKVNLTKSRIETKGLGLISSGALNAIASSCSENLKVLHLSGLGLDSLEVDVNIDSRTFSNLQELHLGNVERAIYNYFSASKLPKLSILHIDSHSRGNQVAFDGLVQILKRNGSQIKVLAIGGGAQGSDEVQVPESLEDNLKSLSNLEILFIDSSWGPRCSIYFSNLSLPNLKSLGGVEDEAIIKLFNQMN